jgi:hypothetical protein
MHFGRVQEVYRNRRICEVLKKPLSVTFLVITKIRWSATFKSIEEAAKHFSCIPAAMEKAERPNLYTSARIEMLSLKGQLDELE